MELSNFELRRSIRPYMADMVITGIISALFIFAAIKNNNATLLWPVLILIAASAATRWSDLRYRVFWKNNAVERITSNGFKTTIVANDISHMEYETSGPNTLLRLNRPSRRITIYSKNKEHLDVSLKHFTINDIRRLMQAIHE